MVIGSVDAPHAKINEQIIDRVHAMKYTLDDKLKLNKQVKVTVSKIGIKLGSLYRNCKFLSKCYRNVLYRSIIEPYSIYCASLMYLL